LTKLPIGKNLITSKWVFKVKKIASGKVDKLEARLIARGFQPYRGLDFDETFTPIVKWPTIFIVVVITSKNQWAIKHLEVKTTFLKGDLEKQVFMYQLQGFEVEGK
jgi:hypothetical protein